MKQMLLLIVFLLSAFLLPAKASAQSDYPRDITLSWINPDSYVDNTLIEAGDLDIIHLDCYRGNELVPMFSANVPDVGEGLPQSETYVGIIDKPGTYRCEAFAFVDGISSDPSEPAFKKYTGKPKAVTFFTFE
jgi:hypothetical protein